MTKNRIVFVVVCLLLPLLTSCGKIYADVPPVSDATWAEAYVDTNGQYATREIDTSPDPALTGFKLIAMPFAVIGGVILFLLKHWWILVCIVALCVVAAFS